MTWLPCEWATICFVCFLLKAYGQGFGMRQIERIIEFSGFSSHLLTALCTDLNDKDMYSSGICYHPHNATTADTVEVYWNYAPEPTTLSRAAINGSTRLLSPEFPRRQLEPLDEREQISFISSLLLKALCADLHDKGLYSSGICYHPPDISTTADTVEVPRNHPAEPTTLSRAALNCLSVKNSWSLIIIYVIIK